MSEKAKVLGEEINTKAMKLTKTDQELIEELRDIVEAMVHKMHMMHLRKMHADIGIDNGVSGPFGYPKLVAFKVTKNLEEWQTEDRPVVQRQQ